MSLSTQIEYTRVGALASSVLEAPEPNMSGGPKYTVVLVEGHPLVKASWLPAQRSKPRVIQAIKSIHIVLVVATAPIYVCLHMLEHTYVSIQAILEIELSDRGSRYYRHSPGRDRGRDRAFEAEFPFIVLLLLDGVVFL